MRIPVKQVGAIGLVIDQPVENIALNAWTAGRNVRFRDGAVEKMLGHGEVYPTPTWAPYWLLPVNTGTTQLWLYAGLAKVGATDGATHADITRAAGGDYTTDPNVNWTGTILEGIPVISNGFDVPQMWNTPALLTRLTALSNWPASTSCRSMRSLKRYLVAMDITKVATRYPYMIKWSDQAPEGGLPGSWDETDETVDAAEWTLPAAGGYIMDGFPLRDNLVIYKEYETWLMQYVGGLDIFRFARVFSSFGSFNRRCAIEFFSGRHIVFTGEDIVLHDSQQAQSVLDQRGRRLIQGEIDASNYQKSFVALNPVQKEVWICFPEVGQTLATRAIVWNWVENQLGLRDLPSAAFIESGVVDPLDASEIWNTSSGDWASDGVSWGERAFDPSQRAMLMAVPGTTKLHLLNSTYQFNGTDISAYVERSGLGFPLKADAPPDFSTIKRLKGIWPRISGTDGGVVNVSVGTQDVADGPISWSAARPYIIGSTRFLDFLATGRLHAVKFESDTNIHWRLHDYDVDIVPVGRY